MVHVTRMLVRFAHVDAAGIVFYPRYFEMFTAAVEDYFREVIGVDFAELHLNRKTGVPMRKLECEFFLPSRLGDQLEIRLDVERVGRSSVDMTADIWCEGDLRVRARLLMVYVDLTNGRPVSWTDDVRPCVRQAAAEAVEDL